MTGLCFNGSINDCIPVGVLHNGTFACVSACHHASLCPSQRRYVKYNDPLLHYFYGGHEALVLDRKCPVLRRDSESLSTILTDILQGLYLF